MNKIIFLVFLTFLFPASGNSQNIIKGKLIDKATSEVIQDANIIILGTPHGTISKSDGTFELETNRKKTTIVFSHLSYSTLQANVSSKDEIQIFELEKSVYQLDIVNIRLGEYAGPTELIKFDSVEYRNRQNLKIKSYSEGGFVIVEDQAEFFGGMDNLKPFIASNFKYPDQVLSENQEGTVYALFTVSEDGHIEDVEVKIVGVNQNNAVITEIIKLFDSMPLWHPAYQRGKPVPVRMVIPILYAANGYLKK